MNSDRQQSDNVDSNRPCTCGLPGTSLPCNPRHGGRRFTAYLWMLNTVWTLAVADGYVICLSLHAPGEGANTVLTGVLKSCSRQKLGAAVSLLTSWILGLPLAYWLAFRHHMGPMGLWLALTITAFLQTVLAGLIIAR